MNDQIIPKESRMMLVTEGDQQIARRIKMMLPYGDKLTDDNALALVAYSRLHGLDPFNGECYFLVREKVDKQTGEIIKREELGCYPGIKGKRKKSKEQLSKADPQATYKIDYSPATAEQVGLGADKAKDIAVIVKAELRDSISTGRYLVDTVKLASAGYSKDEIEAMLGKPPVWVGYGIVYKNELWYIKQTPLDLAKKRAESSATNQRFDLPFADDAIADDIAPEITTDAEQNGNDPRDIEPVVIDAEYKEHKSEDQLMAELGFGEKPSKEPEPELTLEEARNMTTPKGTPLGELNAEQLQMLIDKFPQGAPLHIAAKICQDALQPQLFGDE